MSPTGSHLSLRERRAFIVLAPEQLQLLGGAPGRREQPASRRSIEPAFRIDAQQLVTNPHRALVNCGPLLQRRKSECERGGG